MLTTVLGFLGIGSLAFVPWLTGILGVGGITAALASFFIPKGTFTRPLIFAATGLLVFAFLAYHFYTVEHLTKQLLVAQQDNVTLKLNQQELNQSNNSLVAALAQERAVAKQELDEIANIRQADSNSSAKLAAIQNKIANQERQQKMAKVRNSAAHVDQLMAIVNKSTACFLENFSAKTDVCDKEDKK
jgi:hypothetical protein